MTLTILSLGLKNAPVLNSVARSALNKGVVHLPNTSLPWSDIPERKVYLAGHRLGWPGTGSHLIFYHLNELTGERGSHSAPETAPDTTTKCLKALPCGPTKTGQQEG